MKPVEPPSCPFWNGLCHCQPLLATLMLVVVFGIVSPIAIAQQSRDRLDSARIDSHVGHEVPLGAQFLDHDGNLVQLGEIVSKRPVVLCLVYFECPMLCKLAADGLVRSVASLPENVGTDFDVVFVSFNPEDTPEKATAARDHALRNYARESTADGWHFLTGTKKNIAQLTEAVGFYFVWDEKTKQFAHAAGIMVVSPDGIITEYIDGVNFSPRELISAVNRAANNELTERQSTTFVRCYLYDPTTGKFGMLVQWAIRVLGLATVLGIGLLIYRLNRRGKEIAVEAERQIEGKTL